MSFTIYVAFGRAVGFIQTAFVDLVVPARMPVFAIITAHVVPGN